MPRTKRPAQDPDAAFVCVDCTANTLHTDEYYMVADAVWAAAGMHTDGGMLCIGCIEARLGRALVPADFPNFPINSGMFCAQSPRLQNRIFGDTVAVSLSPAGAFAFRTSTPSELC